MPVHLDRPPEHPHVALVTLDRPERANALNPAMLSALAAAWREIADDTEIRCAVVTGAGERVFCSGMDLRETIPAAARLVRGETLDPETFEGLRSVAPALLAGLDLHKPLVCAVNGHARAGGFDMMLMAEMRVTVPHASFGLDEVALGLYPTGNATVWLPRQIAWVHAQEILLTGRPITAQRALEIGLVNEIAEPGALLERAFGYADAVAGNGPLAVRETRRGVRELLDLPLGDAYARQEEIGRPLRASEDAAEGARSFLEKREPVWTGR